MRREGQHTKIEWVFDSAFRFFPVEPDIDLGWRLSFWDVAVNKVLALAGHAEIRDWVDVLRHNLIGATNGTGGFTMPGDLFGSRALPLDPKVGPLADHGGPTWTMALLPESPCINAGTLMGAPATDQRGVPRPQGTAADIGAYEHQFPVAVITVCEYQPNSGFYFAANAWPNRTYAVQVSTNLQHWSDLTNVITDVSGLVAVLDCNSPASALRIYRLKLLSP